MTTLRWPSVIIVGPRPPISGSLLLAVLRARLAALVAIVRARLASVSSQLPLASARLPLVPRPLLRLRPKRQKLERCWCAMRGSWKTWQRSMRKRLCFAYGLTSLNNQFIPNSFLLRFSRNKNMLKSCTPAHSICLCKFEGLLKARLKQVKNMLTPSPQISVSRYVLLFVSGIFNLFLNLLKISKIK